MSVNSLGKNWTGDTGFKISLLTLDKAGKKNSDIDPDHHGG